MQTGRPHPPKTQPHSTQAPLHANTPSLSAMKLWSQATGRRNNRSEKAQSQSVLAGTSSAGASGSAALSGTAGSDQNTHTTPDLSHPYQSAMHTSHSRSSSMMSHGSQMFMSSSLSKFDSSPNVSNLSHVSLSSVSTTGLSKLSIANVTNDQQRMETLKRTEAALLKFMMKKSMSSSRTNVLRTKLLPLLRYPLKPFDNINELLSTSIVDLNVNLLISEAKCLLSWWSEILNILSLEIQSVPGTDKNCYYEVASRIISLNIWQLLGVNSHYSAAFTDCNEGYKKLLLRTFELSILRLNSKAISLSVSIFIAKVFAYSFYSLPDISRGLTFLLNTKLKSFKQVYNICIHNSFCAPHPSKITNFPSILNDISSQFPDHLIPMISLNVQPRVINYAIEAHFINAVHPPREKIEGIRETKGLWVDRWCSLENVTVFCAFFRNYLTASSVYLKNFPLMMVNEYYVFGMPGFLCFLTHIHQIFTIQINQQVFKNSRNNLKFKNNFVAGNNIPYNDNLLSVPTKVSSETNIDKCFNILHDILVNPRNSNEKLLFSGIIKGYENILKLFVVKTNILDNFKVDIVFNLFVQLLTTIENTDDSGTNSNSMILDWKFWIDAIIKLLDSNHLNSEVKALSVLYQIWDHIPLDLYNTNNEGKHWITITANNLKLNLVTYLINESNWHKFFGHYMPLERNLYNKLIIWKILGLQSLDILSSNYDFKYKSLMNPKMIKDSILSKLETTYDSTKDIVFQPSDPVINKRFKIVKSADEKHRDHKLRVYQFEVFDDTVYTSTRPNPQTVNNMGSNKLVKSASTKSLGSQSNDNITWMGKLFNKNESKGFSRFLKLSKSDEDTSDATSTTSSKTNSPMSSAVSSASSIDTSTFENTYTATSEKDQFYPPEWIPTKTNNDSHEFVLVDNNHRIQLQLHRINLIKNSEQSDITEFLIINDPPKLPSISLSTLKLNKSNESLQSIIDDEDLLSDDELSAMEFGIKLDEYTNTDDVLAYGLATGKKIMQKGPNVDADLIYLSNGLLEFNEERVVFENFISDKISNLGPPTSQVSESSTSSGLHIIDELSHPNISSSSLLEINPPKGASTLKLMNPLYQTLNSQIPKIVPDLSGDRLNAF